jgi:DsbC/DsbD-like thiol-disulfide interchange protein
MRILRHIFAMAFLIWGYFPGVPAALAAPASEWQENQYVRTRLVSSHDNIAPLQGLNQYLGWEIELKIEGWKTYWRSPGDAGKPTVFTWEGSVNLGQAQVFFPYPDRFEIFGIQTYGYEKHLILPIQITPQLYGAPVTINMHADFFACKDICVPMEADYQLELPVAEFSHDRSDFNGDIMAFLARVPGTGGDAAPEIRLESIKVNGPPGHQRVVVELAGERLLSGADVIIEAAPGYRFGMPQKALLGDPRTVRIVIPLSSPSDTADLRDEVIGLSISDGWGHAFEISLDLSEADNS